MKHRFNIPILPYSSAYNILEYCVVLRDTSDNLELLHKLCDGVAYDLTMTSEQITITTDDLTLVYKLQAHFPVNHE